MSDGLLTPMVAFKAAKDLHVNRAWTVRIRLAHPGGARYLGDEQRAAGRTAEVTVDLREHNVPLDELIAARDRIAELGWRAEFSGGDSFDVLGPIDPERTP